MPPFAGALGALALPIRGRSRRISSNEQPNWNDGNMDMTRLAPGDTLEMPVLRGPGVITHVWMTSHAGGAGELDALSLRIYWDDRDEPGVEAPLGAFFAVGQGRPAIVESHPVQVSPTGSLTCYWRMPFAKSARIVVRNDNPDRWTGLYWQVDWMELPELPPDTMYFHARYRQEYPAVMGRDYLIADLVGQGSYVGTVMAVTLAQDGWFGEGDDFFYIDGEDVPSLQGTGSEDYFNDAWGFRERSSTWFGQPRWQGWQCGDSGVCYRWHVLDPVAFQQSLRVTMEHKGNLDAAEEGFFLERPDFFSSVAFWYQVDRPAPFGDLPGWPERCVPWQRSHLVRALPATRVIGSTQPTVSTTGLFGGNPVMVWLNEQQDAELTAPFAVPETGHYAVRLDAYRSADGGAFDIEIDGTVVAAGHSFRSDDGQLDDVLLGNQVLDAGMHALTFRARGPVGRLAVEQLRMLRLPRAASRDFKTHNEAHFVRLGIGRALYAYRLAYGRLPAGLDELVETGIMDARYLRDENSNALVVRRTETELTVTAPAWTHSWQGLDARR